MIGLLKQGTFFVLLGFILAYPVRAQTVEEAVVGQPFGVARVSVPLRGQDVMEGVSYPFVSEGNRAHYPAFTTTQLARQILGGILRGGERLVPSNVTATFLFTGDEPFQVTIYTPQPQTVTVVPRSQPPRVHDRLLRQWWNQYRNAARDSIDRGDYPPLVETYLTSMLAQRLNLEPSQRLRSRQPGGRAGPAETPAELVSTLELLAGAESLRLDAMRETMLDRSDLGQVADQPLPDDVLWEPLPELAIDEAEVTVEPLATHIPPDWLYLRFGRFANYLWLKQLMDDYGGDLSRMVQGRGHILDVNTRLEQQLGLRFTRATELLGDQVIADMAFVGRDTFVRDGAAFGVLMEAQNEFVLNTSLSQERSHAVAREERHGSRQEMVQIAGRRVSLISTPDNRLRSFLAVSGKHRLVTNSRAMVEQFFAVADGATSLGQTPEFLHARSLMPTDREDTLFIYLSSAFFRNLVSPQYQIELQRRLKSVTDLELLRLAQLAARAEGGQPETIEQLVAGGFLPPGFGRRPDGSGPVVADDIIIDSQRGTRGSFLPIPDVQLDGVTADEAASYARRAAFYQQDWKQMDPLIVGIQRKALDQQGREELVIHANVAPFGEEKYGWIASLLGPPTEEKITAAPGDIIFAQASVRGGLLSPRVPPHYLFVGVQDMVPATNMRMTGILQTLRVLQTTPGYVGAWPKPGFLDWLPFGLAGQPDALGYSAMPLGLWRRQFDGFSVLSFDRGVLDHVTPHLHAVETSDPAQMRLHVGDLSRSQLASWIEALWFERARQTSLGNVQLLHALSTQLGIEPEAALDVAESLLQVRLTCPLGGEYVATQSDEGAVLWQSTAWLQSHDEGRFGVPAAYEAPLLAWFRGLDAQLTHLGDRLTVHAQLQMQRAPRARPAGQDNPWFSLFGGQQAAEQAEPSEAEERLPQVELDAPPRPDQIRSSEPREPARGREF